VVDVLSDVIATMRAGEPRSARVQWHGRWGQWFLPNGGSAGFQVILQGSCWLVPPDGAPFALGVGDVVFLPRGRGHGLADSPVTPLADPMCDPLNESGAGQRFASASVGQAPPGGPYGATVTLYGAYQLDPGWAHPMLDDLPELVHLPARLGRHPELRAAVGLLGGELESPRLGVDAIVPALLDMLLLYILRAWFDEQPERGAVTGWTAALRDPAVSAALHGIHRDPAHRWSVAALGALAGLSRAAFSRRFSALVGQPPLAYLTWWRMTTAARLLRESDAPLSVVAERVGYASEFAFAGAFKRRFGTAPGRYRRGTGGGPGRS
jgi:AraC-like DNA-binding protein